MTQINFTLDSEQIQDIISKSGANDLAKQMLTTIFNQLMERERDEYINVDTYSRDEGRISIETVTMIAITQHALVHLI